MRGEAARRSAEDGGSPGALQSYGDEGSCSLVRAVLVECVLLPQAVAKLLPEEIWNNSSRFPVADLRQLWCFLPLIFQRTSIFVEQIEKLLKGHGGLLFLGSSPKMITSSHQLIQSGLLPLANHALE